MTEEIYTFSVCSLCHKTKNPVLFRYNNLEISFHWPQLEQISIDYYFVSVFLQDSLPKPIMYPVSPSNDEDKYTNPELFSNPGSQGDELQSLDEQCQYLDHTDGRSDASSDSFILPPVPPDPKLARLATLGHGGDNLLTSLSTLQALLNNAAPNFLQQVIFFFKPRTNVNLEVHNNRRNS